MNGRDDEHTYRKDCELEVWEGGKFVGRKLFRDCQFGPDEDSGSSIDDRTKRDWDELARSRSAATGKIAIVVGFTSAEHMTLRDVERDA